MPQPVYRRLACALLMLALAACQGAESPRPTTTAPTSAIGAAVPPSPGLERSRNEANKDDALKALLTRRLAELDRRSYRGVTVEVWGGRALLMGAVSKPEQRRKAEQVAAATDGIGEVLSGLRAQVNADTLYTAQEDVTLGTLRVVSDTKAAFTLLTSRGSVSAPVSAWAKTSVLSGTPAADQV
ncbi:MAG TPA: BON domain-containing protein, partial [Magnetospirillum sp.]|nr:BON domain-containing protein [Magnetospirillum sp.]